ncbi:MAG: carbohydrate-binding family 9-like protein [Victivallales bacterium]|nr:carbohydrate-binding family 9-like protein [Victivallales bacterium]
MMKSLYYAFILAFCFILPAMADVPEVPLAFTEEALVVDGEASEGAWQKVAWNEGFANLGNKNTPAQEQTRFKLLSDGNGIWMFFECTDAAIKTVPRPLDDSVWHDDCVEVFLSTSPDVSPDRNIREFYQIIVNPSGSVCDLFTRGGTGDGAWNSMAKAAGKVKDGSWQVEMYIPFAAFPNCKGGAWRFLCGRENWGKKYELSSFPKSLKFQEMDNYAKLTGVALDAKRFGNELASFDVATELGNDTMNCYVNGSIKTSLEGKLDLKCRVLDANKKQVDFVGDVFIPKNGKLTFKLPVNIKSSGKYICNFYLSDAKGLVFTGNAKKDIEIAPCSVETLWPFYRDNIYSTMKDKTARFKITPMVSQAIMKECRIDAEVKHSGGKLLLSKKQLSPKEMECLSVPLAGLAPGKVSATFTMYRGEKLLGKLEKNINILPPLEGGNEIWFDEQRRIVINGELFYPRGFFGVADNAFPVIAQSGGNIVHSYTINSAQMPRIIEFLDKAQANNLKVVLKPYYRYSIDFWGFVVKGKKTTNFDDSLKELTKTLSEGIAKHPAFLGWYLYDEPRGAEYTKNLKLVYDYLREIDPYHLVVGCDNSSGGCINKAGHCDVHWPDIYPSPLLEPKDYLSIPITSLYNQLSSIVNNVGREGVCYVPQSFERSSFARQRGNFRSMTYREIRASVFAGITAGVRGIVPYKIGDIKTKYNEFVPNAGIFSNPHMKLGYLKGIFPELKALEKPLLSPIAKKQATVDNDDIKQITYDCNGSCYVFVLNLKPEAKDNVNITWPGKDASKVRILGNNGKLTAKGGKLTINFAKYDAFVLTDDAKAAPTLDILKLEEEINAEEAKLQ